LRSASKRPSRGLRKKPESKSSSVEGPVPF
jgi:hypothetical protein